MDYVDLSLQALTCQQIYKNYETSKKKKDSSYFEVLTYLYIKALDILSQKYYNEKIDSIRMITVNINFTIYFQILIIFQFNRLYL